jgi:5-dehydro-2-deoxygluconokinase
MPTQPELETFLQRDDLPFRLREDSALEHLHWATTRNRNYDELAVLAIDHRSQFDDLIRELDCSNSEISRFKQLAFGAVDKVAGENPNFGILLDERFGFDILVEAPGRGYWVGRPIEVPRSRPIEFEGAADVGVELTRWPAAHVVKCLAFYHADDPAELRERQERQLLRLFSACRSTGHELLLEIIAPPELPVDESSTARAIDRLYDVGIMPDWWKLEPTSDPAAWRNITDTIGRRDPHCRGVVLLGLSAPISDLVGSFEAAAPFSLIKGFAVGRSIFHDVARDWLTGEIDDGEAIEAMASRFSTLVDAWRSARAKIIEAA